MYGTKQKNGLLSESLVQCAFLEHNLPFSIPYGSFDEYDFVVQTSSGFKSVQVKTCYFDNSKNRFIVSLCTSHRRGGETIKNKKYSESSFDFLIAVCHKPLVFYVIPVEAVFGRRSITLYPDGVPHTSKGNPRYENMIDFEVYKNNWSLLE